MELFSKDKWKIFGLKAGLYLTRLNVIEKNNRNDVEECFSECLSCWLKRNDNVDGVGLPTWALLADIVEEVPDKTTADKIRSRKGQ